jgi:hypothetical protein
MTAWIVLFAMSALFTFALRHGRAKEQLLPPGYEGERQRLELLAMTGSGNDRRHRSSSRSRLGGTHGGR